MPTPRQATLDEFADRCVLASPDSPIVFFAGAGISMSYPSMLPSATTAVWETVTAAAPRANTPEEAAAFAGDTPLIATALPELYYEACMEVIGDQVVDVWEFLEFWKTREELREMGLGPNRGHYLLVYLAWKSRSPIITTNFDTLLERAAVDLGLRPKVYLPSDGFVNPAEDDSVAIWKVHGSVEGSARVSMQTTVRGIAAVDRAKLQSIHAQFSATSADVCLIGYSGRDIDLFPHISSWPIGKRIHWVDRAFPAEHLVHSSSDRFMLVQASSEHLADAVLSRLTWSDTVTSAFRERMTGMNGSMAVDDVEAAYSRIRRLHITETVTALLPEDDPRRLLLHALALYSVGAHTRSERVANLFLERVIRTPDDIPLRSVCRGLLLKAGLAHEFARFEDGERHAEAARRLAERGGLDAVRICAIVAADEARRMQVAPHLGFMDKWHMICPSAWFLMYRFVRDVRLLRSDRLQQSGYDAVRASFARIDHLIRLLAIIQRGLQIMLPKVLVRRILGHHWLTLESESEMIGYAHGIADVRKYAERIGLPPGFSTLLTADSIYQLVSAPNGLAIAHRDAGERLAESARGKETGEREKLVARAVSEYEFALQIARQIPDSLLVLQTLIRLRNIRPDHRVSRIEAECLLARTQGSGFRRLTKRLLDYI